MPLRPLAIILGVALPLLGAGAAQAADVRGDARTTATLRVTTTYTPGVFESVTDSDWYRVRLQAGVDYAVSGETRSGYGIRLNLRDSRGRILRRVGSDGSTDVGTEFRPARSGTYFVEALPLPDQSLLYNVRVAPDCRGDRTTQCALRLGVAQSRATAWSFDEDWFRVQLTGGRNYRVEIPNAGFNAARFVDARGARLGGTDGFTPTATGTYYVEVVAQADNGSPYTVRLVSP